MKFLILLVLATNVYAVTLGQYRTVPEGTSVQSFELKGKKAVYKKHSNFFDTEKDFRLGEFETQVDLSQEKAALEKTLRRVKDVDQFLRKKKSSFNALSTKKPHESFIFLDDYRISQGSDLYPELKKVFDKLIALEWKQVSGLKLSEDYGKLSTLKNGKEVGSKDFNLGACEKAQPPTTCKFKDTGILYLPVK